MLAHHQRAIESITNKLKENEDVLGVIIGGSVAHGFAKEDSDIDVMIVVSDELHRARIESGDVNYFETESTPYEGGYVDGKYTSEAFIRKIAEMGSEPARFAYKDSIVTFSKIDGLDQLVLAASQYPIELQKEKMEKFYAQFETWKWMFYEGLKRDQTYVLEYAISQYVLFAGRLVLAYNKELYPFHKWFIQVLEHAEHKPEDIITLMHDALTSKTKESVEALYHCVENFHTWPKSEKGWPSRFMLDSEINWMTGHVPVADL